jgi:prepilin-type N-terminal cleavage/methylation domain-containing protein
VLIPSFNQEKEKQMQDSILARLRARRGDGGFTLIELLIVIVILGVLAAIVVFSVSGVQNTSKLSACKSDVKTMDTALESYYAQNNTGATHLTDLIPTFLHQDSTITASGKTVTDGGGHTIYALGFTAGSATSAGDVTVTTQPPGGGC